MDKVSSEENIKHLNSLLKSIRNINQLIVKEQNQEKLLQAMCNEIVTVQNFHGVWILIQDKQNKFFAAGFDEVALSTLETNILKNQLPLCCYEKEPIPVYRQPYVDCKLCPLSNSYGNTHAVVVPIMYENQRYGYMGLSIGKIITEEIEEQSLVKEMASDIAFSIYNIEKNKIHEQEQKRYRSLVEHSNDAIYMHTMDGVLLDVNPALENIHGCSKEELIGKNVMDFYQEEQLKIAESHFKTIQENGSISFEMELLKVDGTPFQAELVATLVEFDGEVVIQGSLRDVSKRFQAEQKAQETQKNMILALEGAGHGVWVYNVVSNTTYFSPQYKAMLGYANDELENSMATFLDLLHPDDLVATQLAIDEFNNNKGEIKEKFSAVFRLKAKDDTYRWILSIGNAISIDEDGNILRVIGTHTDITEQKLEEKKFRVIFEQAAVGVGRVGLDGRWLEVNEKLSSIVGYEKEELLTKCFQDITHKDDLKADLIYLEQLINHEVDSISVNKRYIKKDGSVVWVNLNANILHTIDNQPDYFIVIIEDISERKEAEELFQNTYSLLKKISDTITATIYQFKLSPDGRFSFPYASIGIKDIYEVSPEKVMDDAQAAFDVIHPDDLERLSNSIEQSAETLDLWSLEYRVLLPQKGLRWLRGIAKPEKLEDGSVLWHGYIVDITHEQVLLNQTKLQAEALDKSHAGIDIVSEEGIFTYVNQSYIDMWGYTNAEEIIGNSPSTHCQDSNIPTIIINTLKDKEEETFEFVAKRKDGSTFDVLMGVKKIIDTNGTYFLASSLDITKLKENERKLRQSATVFENTTEGVIITDAHTRMLSVNDAFCKITGYTHDEIVGKQVSMLKSGRHDDKFYQELWKSLSEFGTWRGEIWNRRKNGEVYPQWLNINSVKNDLNIVENYIAVFSDITTIKETEAQLDFLAHHDHLTELPNRILLNIRLKHTLSAAKRDNSMTAVMFMDLDNFKKINDSYGHTFGDELLIDVTRRLSSIIREDDTFSRIGGDEFVIVMSHFKSVEQITLTTQKIMEQFEKPFNVGGNDVWISTSLGASIAPNDGYNAETLIKNADTAMYEAKRDGKKTVKVYNTEMSIKSQEWITLESELKAAILNQEFEVYYQPQEDLLNNSIIGFEALVRWHHPSRGLIPPDKFIPIAEETKMILDIGEFVLDQACKDIKKWHTEELCKGRIAVNVSGVQLEHSEFSKILQENIKRHDIDPSWIEIEVTESVVMKNPERWISLLEEIQCLGIAISIDDFGTGYSSLSYLRSMPVNTLKIDRSFIQDIPQASDDCAIVDAIIHMAESLGINTLAEGIETEEQREYLVNRSCRFGQGYLLSKPMNGKDTYRWLNEKKNV